jgi:hypothetical protein
MVVLERLQEKLRDLGYMPMVFNFDKPETKDFRLLAGLSKFVIVDIVYLPSCWQILLALMGRPRARRCSRS